MKRATKDAATQRLLCPSDIGTPVALSTGFEDCKMFELSEGVSPEMGDIRLITSPTQNRKQSDFTVFFIFFSLSCLRMFVQYSTWVVCEDYTW